MSVEPLSDEATRLWPEGPLSELVIAATKITLCVPIGAAGYAEMLRSASEPTPNIFRPTKPNGVGIVACRVGDGRQFSHVHRA